MSIDFQNWALILVVLLSFPLLGLVAKGKTEQVSPPYPELTFQDSPLLVQENTLVAVSSPVNPDPAPVKRRVIVTGYSSTEDQCDSDPWITASGSSVREGLVAANFLPFGTKVRIPEIYGDQVFVVQDRMHPKAEGQVDIWFPSREQALNFGVERTYIEVLGG